jgi:hypothetical protein
MKQVNVALTPELHEALKAMAKSEDVRISDVVRRALARELGMEVPRVTWGKVKTEYNGSSSE